MTDAELHEIEARAKAASIGPWHVVRNNLGCKDIRGAKTTAGAHGQLIGGTCGLRNEKQDRNNAMFIAHARQDIPVLLAEVRRLHAIEKAARALLEAYDVSDFNDTRYEKRRALRAAFEQEPLT